MKLFLLLEVQTLATKMRIGQLSDQKIFSLSKKFFFFEFGFSFQLTILSYRYDASLHTTLKEV